MNYSSSGKDFSYYVEQGFNEIIDISARIAIGVIFVLLFPLILISAAIDWCKDV